MFADIQAEVVAVVNRYLDLVDRTLPGTVSGLHLVGSVALGDYRAGQSDIDFVAVTSSALTARDLDGLEGVHRELALGGDGPSFDGIYSTAPDLCRDPGELGDVPAVLEGRFQRTGGFEANPVTWLILRDHPMPVRGGIGEVWHDADRLRAWNLENLNSYWLDAMSRVQALGHRMPEGKVAEIIGWCVPGVVRLAHTIATGKVTSKSGACQYGLSTYEERWHSIIRQAMAIRDGMVPTEALPRTYLADTAEFMRVVIDRANDSAREADMTL